MNRCPSKLVNRKLTSIIHESGTCHDAKVYTKFQSCTFIVLVVCLYRWTAIKLNAPMPRQGHKFCYYSPISSPERNFRADVTVSTQLASNFVQGRALQLGDSCNSRIFSSICQQIHTNSFFNKNVKVYLTYSMQKCCNFME